MISIFAIFNDLPFQVQNQRQTNLTDLQEILHFSFLIFFAKSKNE